MDAWGLDVSGLNNKVISMGVCNQIRELAGQRVYLSVDKLVNLDCMWGDIDDGQQRISMKAGLIARKQEGVTRKEQPFANLFYIRPRTYSVVCPQQCVCMSGHHHQGRDAFVGLPAF